jgi:hypothetical protein
LAKLLVYARVIVGDHRKHKEIFKTFHFSDDEAANVYLKNLKGTGAKEKIKYKCNICDFEGEDEKLMRGHMSLHEPGNGNYENGVLSHKDGYSCNKCGETTKTMGLIRKTIMV